MKNRFFTLNMLLLSIIPDRIRKGYEDFKQDNEARVGAANMMLLYLGISIGSAFGLALTPTIYAFSRDAGYAFNNSSYLQIFQIIYELGIPALYAMCCVAGLGGTIYAFYRMAKRM